jgi:hypothetical protein
MRLDGREVRRDEYRVDATAVAATPTALSPVPPPSSPSLVGD